MAASCSISPGYRCIHRRNFFHADSGMMQLQYFAASSMRPYSLILKLSLFCSMGAKVRKTNVKIQLIAAYNRR
nr:MAG TPA: hypothetical protein [Caudoviricetes sp.]DAT63280.1 MAG TPA: hypothetical protein [Caudoviricetes sp.]DAX82372.1 MAG TPA: hypothetical protein [Caudoviricetes sp.]